MKMPWSSSKEKKEKKFETPKSMAVIWTDSVYTQAGARPTRGFGGRFYFYGEENKPIEVDGELVIYGYDDSSDDDMRKVADRKFVFSREDLARHHSKTELGPSYSFWVPWDELGGERKTISLLPVFKAGEGIPVRGEQSINVLPGRPKADGSNNPPAFEAFGASQVSYNAPVRNGENNSSQKPSGLKTATIDVPDELGESLAQPQVTNLSRPGQNMQVHQQASQVAGRLPPNVAMVAQQNAQNRTMIPAARDLSALRPMGVQNQLPQMSNQPAIHQQQMQQPPMHQQMMQQGTQSQQQQVIYGGQQFPQVYN